MAGERSEGLPEAGIHRRMDREAVLSAVPAERKRPVRESAKLGPARVLSKRFWKRIGGHHGNKGTPPSHLVPDQSGTTKRWKWPNAPFVATCASERWR
jgi:hypothetical protein